MLRVISLTLAATLFAAPASAQSTTFSCPDECEDIVWGDWNGDSTIDIADLIAAYGWYSGNNNYCPGADINGDGVVNIADVVYLGNYLQGGPAPVNQWCCDQCDTLAKGDVNQDGSVNIADALAITAYLNGTLKDICLAAADVDGDGDIDEDDAKALLVYLFDGGDAPVLECFEL